MLILPKTTTVHKLIFALLMAVASAASANAQDNIIAKVNGRAITETDLRLAEAEIQNQLVGYPPATRRRVVIEFLIENELFADAAAKANVNASPAFKDRQHYWERRNLRDSFFETKIRRTISESDARAFYGEQIKRFQGGPRIRASHILVASEDEAKAIFEQIAHDGDFAELAAKHSTDAASNANGGDLGFFGRGRMAPEFEQAAFATPVGEVALPVKSDLGWHVIKVTDRRDGTPPPFAAVRERIMNRLMHQKTKELAEGLRKNAQIEYLTPHSQ